MAKNILAAQVNTSIMEGTESTFSVDVKDYLGESVDISLITLRCSLSNGDDCTISWNPELGVHELTIPELTEGWYEYEIYELLDTGETVALVTGVIGVFNRDSWQEPVLSTTSPNRTLRIVKADEKGQIEATWLATSAAAGYAYEAKKNADVLKDAMPLILQAAEFMKSFDEALRQAIKVVNNYLWIGGINTGHYLRGEDGVTPRYGADGYWYIGEERVGKARGDDGITPHITSTGYWAIGNVVTNVRAVGRDGIDGTAVRFILVDSYEEIPQSGETCNGGFRYLVRKEGWAVIGEPAATGNGEWEAWEVPAYLLPSEFTHLRVPGVLNANSTPAYLMVRTTGGEVLGVSQNAVTWAVGDVVTWEFAEAVRVPNGAVVQLFLRTTNEGVTGAVPDEGVRLKSLLANVGVCRVRYANVWYGERTPYLLAWGAGASEFYEVYAWVEHDGSAGWVRVDRTNDLATARVYGVMKYGTDMTVVGGAPVGQNAEGQACVPLAGFAVAGTGKLGTATVLTEGGMVGMNVSGNMMTPVASVNEFGSVRLSTSTPLSPSNSGNIGLGENKELRAEKASLTAFGTVRLGSQFGQSNPEPYLVGIGATSDGRLANNYAFGGALQHRQPAGWRGAMSWLDESMDAHSGYFGDMYYSGLLTTAQFSQSSGSGLELLPATTQRLAGVYLASSMTDSRAAAVLTSDVVVNYLNEHYYEKSVVYTKQETLTQIEYKLQPYATISWVSDNFMTRSQIMAELEKKLGCPSGRAKNIEFLTASERESLSSIDQKTAYLVYAG